MTYGMFDGTVNKNGGSGHCRTDCSEVRTRRAILQR